MAAKAATKYGRVILKKVGAACVAAGSKVAATQIISSIRPVVADASEAAYTAGAVVSDYAAKVVVETGPLVHAATGCVVGNPVLSAAAQYAVENADAILGAASCAAGDVSPAVVYTARLAYSIAKGNPN